jgi:hypothetical protein
MLEPALEKMLEVGATVSVKRQAQINDNKVLIGDMLDRKCMPVCQPKTSWLSSYVLFKHLEQCWAVAPNTDTFGRSRLRFSASSSSSAGSSLVSDEQHRHTGRHSIRVAWPSPVLQFRRIARCSTLSIDWLERLSTTSTNALLDLFDWRKSISATWR